MIKKPLVILGIIISVLCCSCSKNNDTTIILLGTESYIPTVREVIPSSLINKVGVINEGTVPPKIEGEYIISPYILKSSTVWYDVVGEVRADRYLRFTAQHNGICGYDTRQYSESAHCDTVYISGSGSAFSVYFIEHRTDTVNGTTAEIAVLISGNVSATGITNLIYGWMLRDKYDPNGIMLPRNSIRVFEDEDGLASRETWYGSGKGEGNMANRGGNGDSLIEGGSYEE
ncbi:MAG: hypothetical protein PHR20_01960 [Bacteroidales bacterium]|nr:hypothetical protein [Bacteroidales bacterium]